MNALVTTASYYRRYRPGIPAGLAAMFALEAATGSPRRLLDIGTGPGTVADALLTYFDEVIAIDTDPQMCVAAEDVLRPRVSALQQLQIRHARGEDFVPPAGWHPQLVTCGRVFHWLDQPRFLDRLNEYAAPDAALVVFSDRDLWATDGTWQQTARSVVQRFLGDQRRAGGGVFGPSGTPYEQVLSASAFSEVTTATIPVHREWSIPEVIGYLYSTSFAAPHLFGDSGDAFEEQLTTAHSPFTDGGLLAEENAFTVFTARRPDSTGRWRG